MVEEEPDDRPQRIMQCTDQEFINDGQLESMGGPHPKQEELNGSVNAELAIGAADGQHTAPHVMKGHQDNVAVYVNSSHDSNYALYMEEERLKLCKDVKDEQNEVLKQHSKEMETTNTDSKVECDKRKTQNNKATCINGTLNNKTSTEPLVQLSNDRGCEKHEQEMQEKNEKKKKVNNSCEESINKKERGELSVCSDREIGKVYIGEKDEKEKEKPLEDDQSEVIVWDNTSVDEEEFVKSEDTVGITWQPRSKHTQFEENRLEKHDNSKDILEEKSSEGIDPENPDRRLPSIQASQQHRRRRRPKRRKQRNGKSRRKKLDHSEEDEIRCKSQTKETIVHGASVPGIMNATGGTTGVKPSNTSKANKGATGAGSKRLSNNWHQSGGGKGGINGGGGGCGGEPPTPPEDWKEKPPCDGPMVNREKKRRPSKRLIMRQDSHSSLPSPIVHGTPFVLNQSPCFSLPPTGVLPTSDLIVEDFIQPAFEHFQSESSVARWLTHNCPPCKTMQACCNHVRKCQEEWRTCTICSKLFDDVIHHVKARHNECGMPFCDQFHKASCDGKEAQFQVLFQFASSFDDPGPILIQPINFPIQREQSLTENILGIEIPAVNQKDLNAHAKASAGGDAMQTVSRRKNVFNDLEEDAPVKSHESSPTTVEDPYGTQTFGSTEDPQVNDTPGHPRYTRPGLQRVPFNDNNKAAFIDHLTNKPYHTREELQEDNESKQAVSTTPFWMEAIDEDEVPEPIRNQVRYGEKRHLRGFLLIWEKLKQELTTSRVKPDHIMTDYEEGVLFVQGLHVENGRYQDGDQYDRLAKIGSGAFGSVFLCKDHKTEFEFVMKERHLQPKGESRKQATLVIRELPSLGSLVVLKSLAVSELEIDLLHFNPDEALIWSEMEHPGIVRLFGVVKTGSTICFFSEFLANRTLKSLVQNGRVLSQGEALFYIDQLLWILKYVHSMKVVHKDLKPENVLVTGEGRLLLIDWGLARVVRRQYIESEQNPEGTQHYMSPEVACCKEYDFGVDIWSLMCIGIHLISGYPPWVKRFGSVPLLFYIVGTKSPPLEDIPEETHPEVKSLLELGMTVEPSDRPSAPQLLGHSAFDLMHQLHGVEAVSPFQERPSDLDIGQCAAPPSAEGNWAPHFAPAEGDVDVNCWSFPTSCLTGAVTPEPKGQTQQDEVMFGQNFIPELDWQKIESKENPGSYEGMVHKLPSAAAAPPQLSEIQLSRHTPKPAEHEEILIGNQHLVKEEAFYDLPGTTANPALAYEVQPSKETLKQAAQEEIITANQVLFTARISLEPLVTTAAPPQISDIHPSRETLKLTDKEEILIANQSVVKDDVVHGTTQKASMAEESVRMPEYNFEGLPNLSSQSPLSDSKSDIKDSQIASNIPPRRHNCSPICVTKVDLESSAMPTSMPAAASHCLSDVSTQPFHTNSEFHPPPRDKSQRCIIRDELLHIKQSDIQQSFGSIPMNSIDSTEDLYGPSPGNDTDEQFQPTTSCSAAQKLEFLQDEKSGNVEYGDIGQELPLPVLTNGQNNCSPTNDIESKKEDCAQIPVVGTEESTAEHMHASGIGPLKAPNEAHSNPMCAGTVTEQKTSQSLCTTKVSSQQAFDMSLPAHLHKPKKRPCIKLAPVFSEAVEMPASDPMPISALPCGTEGQQNRQLFQQELETVPDGNFDTAMQQVDFDQRADVPESMQLPQGLTTEDDETKEPCDSELTTKDQQDIQQFLTDDDDIWRFQGLEGALSGCVSDTTSATSGAVSPPHNPLTTAVSDDDYMTACMIPTHLSLHKSVSLISAEDLEQEYYSLAASTLMHQASGIESPEDQLELMTAAMDLRSQASHNSSYSNQAYNHQTGAGDDGVPRDKPSIEFAAAAFTSGVYSAAASPHRSFSPMISNDVEKSIATLQKQLSTISSSSSNGTSGVKVTVTGEGFNFISIQMGREQTIEDLAIGISAKVPSHISKFTLQTEEGSSLSENQIIGCKELTLVLVPALDDDGWAWRVSCGTGAIEYADDKNSVIKSNMWS